MEDQSVDTGQTYVETYWRTDRHAMYFCTAKWKERIPKSWRMCVH